MLQQPPPRVCQGVLRLSFSQAIRRCLERSERQKLTLERPDWENLSRLLETARKDMILAEDAIIQNVIATNPDTVRVARHPDGSGRDGIIALLPLTQDGAVALLNGKFSGLEPDTRWITPPGVQPTAIYVWLLHMPGSMGLMLSAFAEALNLFLEEPVPVFSRAANAHSQSVHDKAGYIPANTVYPDCPDGLLVVLPEHHGPLHQPQIEISVARTVEDIFQVFSVRSATYLAEQFCLYSEEFDGNDFCSTHWLGKIDGDAAGCIRARFFGDFAKIERLAVRQEYRSSRLAFQLVRAAIDHCQRKGYRTLFGHSRLDLQRFWKVFGFKPVEGRPLIDFANVKYAEMRLDLPPLENAVSLSMDPMHILRPEGAWDRPGPFEAPPRADNALRLNLLHERTRTVRKTVITA